MRVCFRAPRRLPWLVGQCTSYPRRARTGAASRSRGEPRPRPTRWRRGLRTSTSLLHIGWLPRASSLAAACERVYLPFEQWSLLASELSRPPAPASSVALSESSPASSTISSTTRSRRIVTTSHRATRLNMQPTAAASATHPDVTCVAPRNANVTATRTHGHHHRLILIRILFRPGTGISSGQGLVVSREWHPPCYRFHPPRARRSSDRRLLRLRQASGSRASTLAVATSFGPS